MSNYRPVLYVIMWIVLYCYTKPVCVPTTVTTCGFCCSPAYRSMRRRALVCRPPARAAAALALRSPELRPPPSPPTFGVGAAPATARLVLPPPGESSGVAAGDAVFGVATVFGALLTTDWFSGMMDRRVKDREWSDATTSCSICVACETVV